MDDLIYIDLALDLALSQILCHDDANSPKKDKLPLLHQQFVFQAIHQYCAQWSGYQYRHHRSGQHQRAASKSFG